MTPISEDTPGLTPRQKAAVALSRHLQVSDLHVARLRCLAARASALLDIHREVGADFAAAVEMMPDSEDTSQLEQDMATINRLLERTLADAQLEQDFLDWHCAVNMRPARDTFNAFNQGAQ
jgi:hypothetical protein